MPRQMQNKLADFIKAFQEGCSEASVAENAREKKVEKLRLHLQCQDCPVSFNECLGLYKIVMEQDKAFQFRQKKNWHREEVQVLLFMIRQWYLTDLLDIDAIDGTVWERLSTFFSGRSSDDCKFKWLSLSKHPINSCQWDEQEQSLLRQILEEVDYENLRPRWNRIAKLYNQRSHRNSQIYRGSKELKKKWVSTICKIEKGLWKKQEDLILFESVKRYGKRWSYISKLMKELRTQNGVKNRFSSVLDKQKNCCVSKKKIVASEEQLINTIIRKIKQKINESDEKVQEMDLDDSSREPQNQSQNNYEPDETDLEHQAPRATIRQNQPPIEPIVINTPVVPVFTPMPTYPVVVPVYLPWNYSNIPIGPMYPRYYSM